MVGDLERLNNKHRQKESEKILGMPKDYDRGIIELSLDMIIKAEKFYQSGKLIEAANMINKARNVFIVEVKQSSRTLKAINDLQKLHDKTMAKITNSMANELGKQNLKQKPPNDF